ncbi:MAG: hypothetical protein B7Z54_06330 [Sphingobacteriales bacterium 12-47-4]|nr:MAG: hypothetical protein B7Z54_06330 [Sphingobacteriales bacterium 12-47-4]
MKKTWIVLAAMATLTACNSGETKTTTPETPATTEVKKEEPKSNPDYDKGLAIEVKQNCNTCHKIDEKLIGPSYKDIANKYENNDEMVAMLAKKVIEGGQGVWGEIPMAAHPELPEEDAKAIVKYILTFKGK